MRIYRSSEGKIICGVCKGISEYFDVDVTIVRILCLALMFLGGIGVLLYILACLIFPKKGEDVLKEVDEEKRRRDAALLLITIGVLTILFSTVPIEVMKIAILTAVGVFFIAAGVWILRKD